MEKISIFVFIIELECQFCKQIYKIDILITDTKVRHLRNQHETLIKYSVAVKKNSTIYSTSCKK